MSETLKNHKLEYGQQLPDNYGLLLEKYELNPIASQVDFEQALIYLAEHQGQQQTVSRIFSGQLEPFVFGFHSITPNGADKADIKQKDEAAVSELSRMPGFIGYFNGEPDTQTGKCMSWCIWESHETALSGLAASSAHKSAIVAAFGHYEAMVVEHLSLKLINGHLVPDPGSWLPMEVYKDMPY